MLTDIKGKLFCMVYIAASCSFCMLEACDHEQHKQRDLQLRVDYATFPQAEIRKHPDVKDKLAD